MDLFRVSMRFKPIFKWHKCETKIEPMFIAHKLDKLFILDVNYLLTSIELRL